jgi:hypothetical protein
MLEWRDFCRQIGYHYCRANSFLNADQWKLVRTQLVMAVSREQQQLQQQPTPPPPTTIIPNNNFSPNKYESIRLVN